MSQMNTYLGFGGFLLNTPVIKLQTSEAKLFLKLSRPLVLEFCSRRESAPGPEDLLRCCLTEVEAEAWLQIIPEPDCTKVVLANVVLLEFYPPPLF